MYEHSSINFLCSYCMYINFLFHWYYFQKYVLLDKRQNLMEIKPGTCACFWKKENQQTLTATSIW